MMGVTGDMQKPGPQACFVYVELRKAESPPSCPDPGRQSS